METIASSCESSSVAIYSHDSHITRSTSVGIPSILPIDSNISMTVSDLFDFNFGDTAPESLDDIISQNQRKLDNRLTESSYGASSHDIPETFQLYTAEASDRVITASCSGDTATINPTSANPISYSLSLYPIIPQTYPESQEHWLHGHSSSHMAILAANQDYRSHFPHPIPLTGLKYASSRYEPRQSSAFAGNTPHGYPTTFPPRPFNGHTAGPRLTFPDASQMLSHRCLSANFEVPVLLQSVMSRPHPLFDIGQVSMDCAFCVCNASRDDNPIEYASDAFCRMTGYNIHDILNKNCRFLQDPTGGVPRDLLQESFSSEEPKDSTTPSQNSSTTTYLTKFVDPHAVQFIRESLSKNREVQQILINYRRGGVPFLNAVSIIPVVYHNTQYFVGFQLDMVESSESISIHLEGPFKGQMFVRYQHASQNKNTQSLPIRHGPPWPLFHDINLSKSLSDITQKLSLPITVPPLPPPAQIMHPVPSPRNPGARPEILPPVQSHYGGSIVRVNNVSDINATDNALSNALNNHVSKASNSPKPKTHKVQASTSVTQSTPNTLPSTSKPSTGTITSSNISKSVATHNLVLSILEMTSDMVHIVNLRGGIQYASSEACKRILEYDAKDIIGQSISSICHPIDIVYVNRKLEALEARLRNRSTATTTKSTRLVNSSNTPEPTSSKLEMNQTKAPNLSLHDIAQARYSSKDQESLDDPELASKSGVEIIMLYRVRKKHSGWIWFESRGSVFTYPGRPNKWILLVGRERSAPPYISLRSASVSRYPEVSPQYESRIRQSGLAPEILSSSRLRPKESSDVIKTDLALIKKQLNLSKCPPTIGQASASPGKSVSNITDPGDDPFIRQDGKGVWMKLSVSGIILFVSSNSEMIWDRTPKSVIGQGVREIFLEITNEGAHRDKMPSSSILTASDVSYQDLNGLFCCLKNVARSKSPGVCHLRMQIRGVTCPMEMWVFSGGDRPEKPSTYLVTYTKILKSTPANDSSSSGYTGDQSLSKAQAETHGLNAPTDDHREVRSSGKRKRAKMEPSDDEDMAGGSQPPKRTGHEDVIDVRVGGETSVSRHGQRHIETYLEQHDRTLGGQHQSDWPPHKRQRFDVENGGIGSTAQNSVIFDASDNRMGPSYTKRSKQERTTLTTHYRLHCDQHTEKQVSFQHGNPKEDCPDNYEPRHGLILGKLGNIAELSPIACCHWKSALSLLKRDNDKLRHYMENAIKSKVVAITSNFSEELSTTAPPSLGGTTASVLRLNDDPVGINLDVSGPSITAVLSRTSTELQPAISSISNIAPSLSSLPPQPPGSLSSSDTVMAASDSSSRQALPANVPNRPPLPSLNMCEIRSVDVPLSKHPSNPDMANQYTMQTQNQLLHNTQPQLDPRQNFPRHSDALLPQSQHQDMQAYSWPYKQHQQSQAVHLSVYPGTGLGLGREALQTSFPGPFHTAYGGNAIHPHQSLAYPSLDLSQFQPGDRGSSVPGAPSAATSLSVSDVSTTNSIDTICGFVDSSLLALSDLPQDMHIGDGVDRTEATSLRFSESQPQTEAQQLYHQQSHTFLRPSFAFASGSQSFSQPVNIQLARQGQSEARSGHPVASTPLFSQSTSLSLNPMPNLGEFNTITRPVSTSSSSQLVSTPPATTMATLSSSHAGGSLHTSYLIPNQQPQYRGTRRCSNCRGYFPVASTVNWLPGPNGPRTLCPMCGPGWQHHQEQRLKGLIP